MAELYGVDLTTHIKAILSEFRSRQSIYGYPLRKMYRGFAGHDFSVTFHDKVAATPLGPASGPHTQLAQNILLSFLGGGRIIELKTIQILDQLDIPRPCIYAPNVGYNVEWSQELRLEDSYREYVIAWILIKFIEALELLEVPRGDPFYHTVFDISVGYDLKGITSQPVCEWLENMKDASGAIQAMVDALPGEFAHLKKFPVEPQIANSATLSTFHGCPRDEIEAIVQHLIEVHRFHVIVKMNPTILGYDFVRKTLQDDLQYKHLELDPAAFENDLQFDEAIEMMKRLQAFAARFGKNVGAKFTNTLVVKNNQPVFEEEVMYLSGPPLHVLAMNAMHRFREALGSHFHISFSAGISKHNFADAVRCNMRPITVCTDLLKTGGYTRMFDYLKNLYQAMEAEGVHTLPEFIRKSSGLPSSASLAEAGMENARRLVPRLAQDPRYQFQNNRKNPPKVDSHLQLFDCLTCNKCLPVCPNAANFSIPCKPGETIVRDFEVSAEGLQYSPDGAFKLEKKHQIANIADWCNECGNCDTYCPEHGGPFIEKPRFFLTRETYRKFRHYDGFYFSDPYTLQGRLEKVEYQLAFNPKEQNFLWKDNGVELLFNKEDRLLEWKAPGKQTVQVSTKPYHTFKTLLLGFLKDPENYPAIILMGTWESHKATKGKKE